MFILTHEQNSYSTEYLEKNSFTLWNVHHLTIIFRQLHVFIGSCSGPLEDKNKLNAWFQKISIILMGGGGGIRNFGWEEGWIVNLVSRCPSIQYEFKY